MPNDFPISDDPGTVLDSFPVPTHQLPVARSVFKGPPVPPPKPAGPQTVEEVLYRSPYRYAAPRITICDDGSLEDGEVVHVRSDRIVIGRSKGDILIPHDVAMSASHAEIARVDVGGKHAWVVRDLDSSNGTLVRCRAVTLRPGMTLLIGSKRYRFEVPTSSVSPSSSASSNPKTSLVDDLAGGRADSLPALIETTPTGDKTPSRHPFRSLQLAIGRPGFGNNIELDDLCVAKVHAIVTRDASGVWQVEAQPSLNGIWVKIDAVKLTDNCLFQCGEQRFKFVLP
jgi:pSer/pThr/pTyr-binding forkhead associated (FHA) protein